MRVGPLNPLLNTPKPMSRRRAAGIGIHTSLHIHRPSLENLCRILLLLWLAANGKTPSKPLGE